MKKLLLIVAVLSSLSCNTQKLESDQLIEQNQFLIGTWKGDGKFLDVELDTALGTIPIRLEIKEDKSILASIGEASLEDIQISKAKYGFEIKGILNTAVKKGKEENKKHLILLFLVPTDADSSLNYVAANFHLKSNFSFDVTMRVGGVKLQKESNP
jgi:hypothetical protein